MTAMTRFPCGDPEKDSFLIILFEHFDALQAKARVLDESRGRFGSRMAEEHGCSQPLPRPVSLCGSVACKEAAARPEPFCNASDQDGMLGFRQVSDGIKGRDGVERFRRELHRGHVGQHEFRRRDVSSSALDLPAR
jgi:hypothetical protein